MTSLRSTRSLAWSWWRSMWNLWRREQRLSKTMPNNWGRPQPLVVVLLSYLPQILLCECAAVCLLVFAFVHVKRLFMKCLWGLMTTLGQNLACLWNTGLILQLQCARSLALSLFMYGAPSPSCFPVQGPTSAELCWRGEEVGADWHMIDRMWSERERKKEEQLF